MNDEEAGAAAPPPQHPPPQDSPPSPRHVPAPQETLPQDAALSPLHESSPKRPTPQRSPASPPRGRPARPEDVPPVSPRAPPTEAPAVPEKLTELEIIRLAHKLYEAVVGGKPEDYGPLLARCAHRPDILERVHCDGMTCLQAACGIGKEDWIPPLLEAGADPERQCPESGRRALHWAATDHHALRRLLAAVPALELDPPDRQGFTPLHEAVLCGRPAAILTLLRAGADVDARDPSGRPVLHLIPADLLRDHLDGYVTAHGDATQSDFSLELDFAPLWPAAASENCWPARAFETSTVYHMADSPQHRHLLRHPLVTAYLELRWWRVKPFFVLDLLNYFVLASLLTALALVHVERESHDGPSFRTLYQVTATATIWNVIKKGVQFLYAPARFVRSDHNGLLKVPLLLMAMIFVFGELPRTCLPGTDPPSMLQAGNDTDSPSMLQTGNGTSLPEQCADPAVWHKSVNLSIIMVVFSWLEMSALLSRLPVFSLYDTMFRAVLRRFCAFLACYLMLVFGFALSMSVLFDERRDADGQPYNLKHSVLRILVMILDKLDLTSLQLNRAKPPAAELIYVACLFVTTVVLTNLLNALVISDMAALRRQALTESLANRARLLAFSESMMRDGPLQFLGRPAVPRWWAAAARPRSLHRLSAPCRFGGWREFLARLISLTPLLPERRLRVLANQAGRPTEPPLSTYYRLPTALLARVRRLARSAPTKPSLEQKLSELERTLRQDEV